MSNTDIGLLFLYDTGNGAFIYNNLPVPSEPEITFPALYENNIFCFAAHVRVKASSLAIRYSSLTGQSSFPMEAPLLCLWKLAFIPYPGLLTVLLQNPPIFFLPTVKTNCFTAHSQRSRTLRRLLASFLTAPARLSFMG